MITRVLLAVIVAIVTGLLLMLAGSILVTLKVPIADAVGGWLERWGWTLGILAGLWFFFAGRLGIG